MTLEQAKKQAVRLARGAGSCYYVIQDGEEYRAILAYDRVLYYSGRSPLFTAAPDGRTSTP